MPFECKNTPLEGVKIIQPRVFKDPRGFFMETYKKSEFETFGIFEEFVQDNHSFSSKGVLRGIHSQSPPFAQGKLVRVVKGAVWDVAVDLQKDSQTFLQWFGIELTEENNTMLYIPPAFGHGFLTLRDNTHFQYKCTADYSPENEVGIRWDDPDIGIGWPVAQVGEPFVSERDEKLPYLKEILE